ncbi:type II secretion system protein [Clostridium tetanomorphum]|nr:type II secretion system protein [Clostridium tetanomorphum]MBP1863918.1 prepilin-type N-terminal cleavage/methylation domain-containing protein [Clostridium tetanomorphum]SQB91478.1 prepilin peptidase [Clostridium tetanomorphum]
MEISMKKIYINNLYIKKGFTVIETLFVITLISIASTFIAINIKGIKNITNNMDSTLCDKSIINFINNGKQYCRTKSTGGRIYFSLRENSIIFYANAKTVDKYRLPRDFKFTYVNASRGELKINANGMTNDACTVIYKDRKGNFHEITICVGTAHVQIK